MDENQLSNKLRKKIKNHRRCVYASLASIVLGLGVFSSQHVVYRNIAEPEIYQRYVSAQRDLRTLDWTHGAIEEIKDRYGNLERVSLGLEESANEVRGNILEIESDHLFSKYVLEKERQDRQKKFFKDFGFMTSFLGLIFFARRFSIADRLRQEIEKDQKEET
jgi:hypothetical protein